MATGLSPGAQQIEPAKIDRGVRYYRPELDALRFFAFLCVLLRHGEPIPIPLGGLIQECGSFGLSLFFFLSAFLITELLLREREKTSTVHLRAFYIRRILRIWPLYYFAVFLAVVIGRIWPDPFWIGKFRLVSMVFFFMNWLPQIMYGPFTVLWSISVEEQFYAIWPAVVKRGVRSLKVWSALLILGSFVMLSIPTPRHFTHPWLNTLVEFLFFGTGALTALAVHKRHWSLPAAARIALAMGGICCWGAAQQAGKILDADRVSSAPLACFCYLIADAGCAAILLAALGIRSSAVPNWLTYLGKISYGLYVFHKMFLMALDHSLRSLSQGAKFTLVDGGAVLLSICMASLSYHFMERPINRIKERFSFVPSRPA